MPASYHTASNNRSRHRTHKPSSITRPDIQPKAVHGPVYRTLEEESHCCALGNPQLSHDRSFQCSTIRFDFLRNSTQVLSRTWKDLEKDAKCISFPKGEKSKGKCQQRLSSFFFFFTPLKRNHTRKGLSIKRFHLTGEDGIEQEERSFSCSHADALCTSEFSLLVAREKELVSGLQVYRQSQCGKSSRLHSILPFKAASCHLYSLPVKCTAGTFNQSYR